MFLIFFQIFELDVAEQRRDARSDPVEQGRRSFPLQGDRQVDLRLCRGVEEDRRAGEDRSVSIDRFDDQIRGPSFLVEELPFGVLDAVGAIPVVFASPSGCSVRKFRSKATTLVRAAGMLSTNRTWPVTWNVLGSRVGLVA